MLLFVALRAWRIMPNIIECREFEELSVRVSSLLQDGELQLDERITTKGYLTATMRGGQVVLRATRFVGTIPLTPGIAVRIVPRATISNLSYMLVHSGVIPSAISGFVRGYMPRFVTTNNAELIYARSLIAGVRLIARKGYMKEYLAPRFKTPWRGRLIASDTVRKHASKGIRYRHEFEQSVLTPSTVQNIALKVALKQVIDWFVENDHRNPMLREARDLYHGMWHISDWEASRSDLVRQLSKKIQSLSSRFSHYRDPLWSAYLILQSALPELSFDGFVRLESLIIDVSQVFEAFLRRELAVRLAPHGYRVRDGNNSSSPFFIDGGGYSVHPDMIICQDDNIVAVLDAKYKPEPKETDRYEVLSFMDAMPVTLGGFVCPADGIDTSRYLGTTASGKEMVLLRYDLAASDQDAEADRFANNVLRMINGNHEYS
ncbi:hypothetical protein TH30_22220 [Thalassospira profundimaris]|uniref:McrBC 5-methylcytosine restriction system component n=3 Tax=Thalassospiraceae TaxID=2844866 RepID=A0A367WHY8_9PROT|nr:hypothetical protein TH30_22220 [Thalassospira profundimaris]